LDEYLRGLQGNPSSLITIDHLLYGTPPPGLDVRLSIDLPCNNARTNYLAITKAAILLNAQNGEILSWLRIQPMTRINSMISAQASCKTPTRHWSTAPHRIISAGDGIKSLFTSDLKLNELYKQLGFYTPPNLFLPVAPVDASNTATIRVSPLQMALAAAALSDHGMRPAPRIALL